MTDLQLIKKIINGETSCFEQLVCRYEKQLMRFLKLRCFNFNDAEDVFQETFLNAHLYLKSYDSRFAFSTWLFNISLNIVKKHNRANDKLPNQQAEIDSLDNFPAANKTSLNISMTAAVLPKDNIWATAKEHLNDEQLSLIWFTYAEEYSGSDVAIILERSLPWVKINLIRVKSLLKAKLIEKGFSLDELVRG